MNTANFFEVKNLEGGRGLWISLHIECQLTSETDATFLSPVLNFFQGEERDEELYAVNSSGAMKMFVV